MCVCMGVSANIKKKISNEKYINIRFLEFIFLYFFIFANSKHTMSWTKFKAPPNLVETEPQSQSMKMDSKQSKDQQLLVIQRQLSNPDTLPETRIALAELKVKLETGVLADSLNDEFVNDFNMWLLGRSPYNTLEIEIDEKTGLSKIPSYDTQMGFNPNGKHKNIAQVRKNVRKLTPWGTKPMTFLPEVQTYLSTLVDSRTEVMRYFSQLEMRLPANLEELWMYYKYKVRAVGVDGWIIKTLRQMEPYDFIPKDKIPEGGSYGPGQPQIENAWGIQNPVPPPGYQYQDSIYFVKSLTELVLKTKNLSLSSSEQRKNLTKAEIAKLKKDIDAKYEQISVGMQQTLGDLGVSSEYLYKEYIRSKGLREYENLEILKTEQNTGISQNVQINTPYIKPFVNSINNNIINIGDNRKQEQGPMDYVQKDTKMEEADPANFMEIENPNIIINAVENAAEENIDEILEETEEDEFNLNNLGISTTTKKAPTTPRKKTIPNTLGIPEEDKKKYITELQKEQQIKVDYISNVVSKIDDNLLKGFDKGVKSLEESFAKLLAKIEAQQEKVTELTKKVEDLIPPPPVTVIEDAPMSEGEKEIKEETLDQEMKEGKAESYVKEEMNAMNIQITALTTKVKSQNKEISDFKNKTMKKLERLLKQAPIQEINKLTNIVNVIDERLEFTDEFFQSFETTRTLEEQKIKHFGIVEGLSKGLLKTNTMLLDFFTNILPTMNWSPAVADAIYKKRQEYHSMMKDSITDVSSKLGTEQAAYYMANQIFLFDNLLFDYMNEPRIPKVSQMDTSVEQLKGDYDPFENPNDTDIHLENRMSYLNAEFKSKFPSFGYDLKQETTNKMNETQLIAGTLNNDIVTYGKVVSEAFGMPAIDKSILERANENPEYLQLLYNLATNQSINPDVLANLITGLSREGNAPLSLLATKRMLEDNSIYVKVTELFHNQIVAKLQEIEKTGKFGTRGDLKGITKSGMRDYVSKRIVDHMLVHPTLVRAKHQEYLKSVNSIDDPNAQIIAASLGLNTDYLKLAKMASPMDVTPSLKKDLHILSNLPDNIKPIYEQMFYAYRKHFKTTAIPFHSKK